MKGTMTNTRKGTSLKRSAQVLSSCREKSTAEIITQPDTQNMPKEGVQPLSIPLYPGVVALTLLLSLLVSTCPWSSLHTILAATLVSVQSRWNPRE